MNLKRRKEIFEAMDKIVFTVNNACSREYWTINIPTEKEDLEQNLKSDLEFSEYMSRFCKILFSEIIDNPKGTLCADGVGSLSVRDYIINDIKNKVQFAFEKEV